MIKIDTNIYYIFHFFFSNYIHYIKIYYTRESNFCSNVNLYVNNLLFNLQF